MELKNPFFSVITVSYNSQDTIGQTLKSILNQTHTDFEYIIIDGGSTDNTLSEIEKYRNLFSQKNIKFTCISEKDEGIYDAMNKGIKLSKGEWISIVNSDDFLSLNALELVINILNRNTTPDLIHGNIRVFSEADTEVLKPDLDLRILNVTMNIFHPSVFVRRKVYLDLKFFDKKYKLTADWDFLKKVYNNGYHIQYIDEVLSNFRKGGAGSGFKRVHLIERYQIRHKTRGIKNILYDAKDILILLYYTMFPKKPLF
jgi:glycosyltransferase involved in cell wall biosynthesis